MALNTFAQTLDTADVPTQRPVLEQLQDAVIETVLAVKELQRLRVTVIAGAGAATPIALAGIATTDTIVAALLFKDPATIASTAAVAALTASIPSAGNVQFVQATNAEAGDRVVVCWFDKI